VYFLLLLHQKGNMKAHIINMKKISKSTPDTYNGKSNSIQTEQDLPERRSSKDEQRDVRLAKIREPVAHKQHQITEQNGATVPHDERSNFEATLQHTSNDWIICWFWR